MTLIVDQPSVSGGNGEVPDNWADLIESLGLADEITSEEYADGVITSEEFGSAGTSSAFSTFGGLGDTATDIQLSDLQQVWKSADLKQQSGLATSIIDATDDFLGASNFVNFSEADVDTAYASFTAANHDLSAMDPATRALLGEDDEISASEYAVFLYYLVTKGMEDGDITDTNNIDIADENGEFATYQQRVIEGYVPGSGATAAAEEETTTEVQETATDLFAAINALNTNIGIEGVDTSDGLTEAELDLIIASEFLADLTTEQQAAINDLKLNFATYNTTGEEETPVLTEEEINVVLNPIVEEEEPPVVEEETPVEEIDPPVEETEPVDNTEEPETAEL